MYISSVRKLFILLTFSLFNFHFSLAQAPLVKQWDARFGGDSLEYLYALHQTMNDGYILGGQSKSDSTGDKTQHTRGEWDFWVVKTDSIGNKQWDKRFGGNGDDFLYAISQTRDGGFIMTGSTFSDSTGDVTAKKKGNIDCWIVKTDLLGNKLWDKRLGGTGADEFTSLAETPDGGFLFGGTSSSDSSGDKTQKTRGSNDFWIVKTDSLGHKQWDKRYGGTLNDRLYSLQQTTDKGFLLGGYSTSDSTADKTQSNRGFGDYWIVKIDSSGNKQWDKRFGGASFDYLYDLHQTKDGGYILGGYATSDSGGDVTEKIRGSRDYWIVKTDSLGNKEWDKRFGGSLAEDEFGYVIQTREGGYMVSGASYSAMSGDKSENNLGFEQPWIVKTDCAGNKLWDKTIFTAFNTRGHDEEGYAIQTRDGGYAVANYSFAADTGGYKSQKTRGSWDFWLVKFRDTASYSGSQAGVVTALRDTICSGTPASLSVTNNFGVIQWQSSVTPSRFSNVPGASNTAYLDIPAQTTYYRTYAVNNLCGDTSAAYRVVVRPSPIAEYDHDTAGLKITFNSQGSSNDVTVFEWDFGDSTTSILPNPVHTFKRADTFHVCLTVFNGSNCSFTICKDIKADIGTSVTAVIDNSQFEIYPNPADQSFRIFLDKQGKGIIRIYNTLGQLIYKNEIISEQTISTADFPQGNYYITLQTDVTVEAKKFMLIH